MSTNARDLIIIFGTTLLYWLAAFIYLGRARGGALRHSLTTVVDTREVDIDDRTKELTVRIRVRLIPLVLLFFGPPAILVLMWAALR